MWRSPAGPSPCTSTSSGCPCRSRPCSIPWWALALAFAVTEIAVVHVHFRRSSHALTLGELPLVVGLLFCAPGEVMIAWVAGAALVLVFSPGRVAVRVAFNLALLAVTAGDRPRRLPHRGRASNPSSARRCGSAATVAVLLAVVASVLLVNAAMWLSGRSHRATQARLDRRDVDLRRGHQHEPRARARDGGGDGPAGGRAAAGARAGGLPRLPRPPRGAPPDLQPRVPARGEPRAGERLRRRCRRRRAADARARQLPRRGGGGLPVRRRRRGRGDADLGRRPARARGHGAARRTRRARAERAHGSRLRRAARHPGRRGRRARRPSAARSASRARCSRRCPARAGWSGP